jgi:nicotinamide mononucleotide transporter
VFGMPKDNILVLTGLVSTSIFVYLLWKWTLWGDMMINGYYFVMSICGYHWTRKKGDAIEFPISKFPAPKTNCDNSFYIYGSLCGFGISLFRKIYHLMLM